MNNLKYDLALYLIKYMATFPDRKHSVDEILNYLQRQIDLKMSKTFIGADFPLVEGILEDIHKNGLASKHTFNNLAQYQFHRSDVLV